MVVMDELNYSLTLDIKLTELMKGFSVHHNVFTFHTRPGEISDYVYIPKPVLSCIDSWLTHPNNSNPEQTNKGREIFNSLIVN